MRMEEVRGSGDALWMLAGSRSEALKLKPVADSLGAQVCALWLGAPEDLPGEVQGLHWRSLPLPRELRQARRASLVRALRLRIGAWLLKTQPRAVLVQGATDASYATAQACHALDVPLVHLDAGWRSGDLRSPFPEEAYRRTIARIAALQLAPSRRAELQLRQEGVPPESIVRVGSTAVDGLREVLPLERRRDAGGFDLLVDLHRHENHGEALAALAQALKALAVHGWRIGVLAQADARWQRDWSAALGPRHGLERLPPLARAQWLALANDARLVLSDSGAAAEELPYLGVPLLVYRRGHERMEALETRHARVLAPAPAERLVTPIEQALRDPQWPAAWPLHRDSPYGDGRAGQRAARVLKRWLATFLPARPARFAFG